MKRNYMEYAIAWLAILGPILLAYAVAVWGFTNGNRTSALWTGVGGIGMLVFATALQIQDNILRANAPGDTKLTVAEMNQGRAYLSVVDGDALYTPGKPPTVALILRNTGLTEARDVRWNTQFALASVAPDIPLGRHYESSKITLPAQASLSYQFTLENWDAAWERSLRDGTVAIVAEGEIQYTDIYGNDWSESYRLISGGAYGPSKDIAAGKFGRPRVIRPKSSD
jgi:hypothetical protein